LQEAEVNMNTNVLLSTAAVGLVIAGGAAYTMRSEPARSDQQVQAPQVQAPETKPHPRTRVERVMDPAGDSTSARADQSRAAAQDPAQKSAAALAPSGPDHPAQKNVRVVYPNVQSFDTTQSAGQGQPSTSQPSVTPSRAPVTVAVSDQAQPAAPSTTPAPPLNAPAVTVSTSGPAAKGIVALNAQQQTQVGQTISQRKITPLTNVNFSIAIGTKVPRSVQLRALPSDLVSVVPDYRGYSYFVVEEQIMIVEPASHEIVAIVPYTGAGPAPAPSTVADTPAPTNSRAVSLNTEQRDVLKKQVKERRTSERARKRSPTATADGRAPRPVTVETEIRPEAAPVRRNRFIREDDDVMLIDPEEGRLVIEQPRPFFSGWR